MLRPLLLGSMIMAGCGGKVCPTPSEAASPAWADSNADGTVDVNDGVLLVRHALAGGDPPVCEGQGDLLATGDVATESAVNLWSTLTTGVSSVLPELEGCSDRHPRGEAPPCASVDLAIEAPRKEEAAAGGVARFEARVTLRTSGLEGGPDAWSFGVAAQGCAVVGSRFDGTASASTFDDPPGVVDAGYAWTEVVEGGAVSLVVPSWLKPRSLATEEGPRELLVLEVEADVPASGCSPCTLEPVSELRAGGEPVALVVGKEGWSYAPHTRGAEIRVCASR